MRPSTAVVAAVALLLLAGCGDTPGDVLPDPRDGRSGIQMSGLLPDRQIALSEGLPTINFGDCDIPDGPDEDFCIITRDINGERIVVVVENPAVLVEGARLPVGVGDCTDPPSCDAVRDVAIIELQFGTGPRIRAVSGQLAIEVIVPGQRVRGSFDIRLPDGGTLNATLDLVPRPDELR
ncbi:hypothetical protein BH23ACT9_BH23ACT9_29300 [soil metagenome]